jgi:hypothetical protein
LIDSAVIQDTVLVLDGQLSLSSAIRWVLLYNKRILSSIEAGVCPGIPCSIEFLLVCLGFRRSCPANILGTDRFVMTDKSLTSPKTPTAVFTESRIKKAVSSRPRLMSSVLLVHLDRQCGAGVEAAK